MSEEDCSSPSVEEKKYTVTTERCGTINFYVQGDLSLSQKKAVFLTVHDLGSNHTMFHDFIDHPAMFEVKNRSIFIHVDVPGQEDHAPDLPENRRRSISVKAEALTTGLADVGLGSNPSYEFPTMQMIAEDLAAVLDHLKIPLVVGLGEGAGANILARFGIAHPTRVLGLILIHCTSNSAGVMEYVKDKFINWRLGSVGMNPTAEQYLVFHKFGGQMESVDNKEKLIQEYTDKLKTSINPRNLKRYVESFLNRSDFSANLEKNLSVESLLVTGAKASHNKEVHAMHSHMNKTRTSLLKVEGVGDVLTESPEKLAHSLLLFCKGLGLLTSMTMPGIERQRTVSGGEELIPGGRRRTMSMEEYDKPRRLSVTAVMSSLPSK